MPRHKVEGESKEAAAKRDDELVERAAKRADWAGNALDQAADDLEDVGAVTVRRRGGRGLPAGPATDFTPGSPAMATAT